MQSIYSRYNHDNDFNAAVGEMSAMVLVANGEAYVRLAPWPDRFHHEIIGNLRSFELVAQAGLTELHFKYSTDKQLMLGLATESFRGDPLLHSATKITRVSLWIQRYGQAKLLCRRPATLERDVAYKVIHEVAGPINCSASSITILSHGSMIIQSNFWDSGFAEKDCPGISMLEGHLRLLVPDNVRVRMTERLKTVSQLQIGVLPTSQWKSGQPCAVLLLADGHRFDAIIVSPDLFIGPWPDINDGGLFQASVWVSKEGKPHCVAALPAFWTLVPDLDQMAPRID